jgi:hypothetical protein
MGYLDWMEGSKVRSMHDDEGHGWEKLGVYLYRADGRYPPATWAETPKEFGEMIPAIRAHIHKKLEVRITNSEDHLLFHATQNGIEWDGIGLRPFLHCGRSQETAAKAAETSLRRKPSPDR